MIDIEIKGLIEFQRKMQQIVKDLAGAPMYNAMRDSTLAVLSKAKRYAPVDTGRLRASIAQEVRVEGTTVEGVVGSNVVYAPFMELGTRPHWPPIAAMEPWARRHGMSAFQVALAISRKGTAARKYLQRAFEESTSFIIRRFEQAVKEIVE